MNHPNRSIDTESRNPTPAEVKAAREAVQKRLSTNVTESQKWCGLQVHASVRGWQQWENGDRRMHPAFWELFLIKTGVQI
jgi:DNA (cytosine-5)-methyltransferase 1